jgi:hypothetical protein
VKTSLAYWVWRLVAAVVAGKAVLMVVILAVVLARRAEFD